MIERLMSRNPGIFIFNVSCTTRKPRQNEVDGEHYHFISLSCFEKVPILTLLLPKCVLKQIEEGLFIEK